MVEKDEIRFGTVAVKRGYITSRQLGEAVGLQLRMDLENGDHKLIGQVLVDMGLMTTSQVNEVLQEREIGP